MGIASGQISALTDDPGPPIKEVAYSGSSASAAIERVARDTNTRHPLLYERSDRGPLHASRYMLGCWRSTALRSRDLG